MPIQKTPIATLLSCLALCAAVSGVSGVSAQTYPNRPVKIIAGSAPGGALDTMSRLVAQKLTPALGQSFVVENRAGAGSTLGPAFVAKAPADGYTLLLGETSALMIAPYVYRSLPYNTVKDFAPVSLLISLPLVLVSSAKTTQIKTMADLVREAKANPGKLDYGTPGVGTIHHIAMEALKADLGINLSHVPYKGGAPSIAAMLSGELPIVMTSMGTLGQNAAQAHILAVTAKDRLASVPDVPSAGEIVKGYDFSSQMGVLAPAGTSPEIVNRLAAALKTAMTAPDMLESIKIQGFVPMVAGPEGYAANIKAELEKYARAVKLANVPLE